MGKIINPFGGNDSTSNPPIQNESTPLPEKDLETELVQEKAKLTELPEGYVDIVVNGQSRRRLKTYHEELNKPKTPKELRDERLAKRQAKREAKREAKKK